ncbi:hypothetical protein [Dysgonomonas macrotermitis]|uniref:Uncharacterized protein n=1 Tax=Dysgonomonas macrotermitis TaxID=1346286 RepID=A0A1M5JT14_9BACT|nr:hypothetical protein [Dysgonomonas macrotermitis]SHG43658.1 hypothetical protein SAMN05444362_1286 [Dysgonomonas macrotermitis]
MNTKICLILVQVLSVMPVNAQIGMQTENPQGILHVDLQRNASPSGSSGTADDVMITNTGQMGIGTVNPRAKLDIRGSFCLRDGNQTEGKMLMSDTTGNAKWGDRPRLEFIEVENVNGLLSGKTFTATPSYSGVSITLPEGTWQIMFQATCNAQKNIFWDLCESPDSYSLPDISNRRGMSSGLDPVSVTAIYFVTNSGTKTFYIWASTISGTATYLAGGTLWALPIE